MNWLYRKALELARKAWDFARSYAYLRTLRPQDNPNDVHKAIVASISGRDMAEELANNPGATIEDIIEEKGTIPYIPGKFYKQEEFIQVFPEVVEEPYALDIIVNIDGINQSGYQQYRVDVNPGDTWANIEEELYEQIFEDYDITGPYDLSSIPSMVVGIVFPEE